jgi:hypothetical protein
VKIFLTVCFSCVVWWGNWLGFVLIFKKICGKISANFHFCHLSPTRTSPF